MKIFFGAILLVLCALAAEGKIFYVSNSGSDKNPGTKNAPWKTIGFAAKQVSPGDTVKIMPGLYREQVIFTRSGKKNAPITFEGVRGKDGTFLSIIEGMGNTLTKWVPAPEIAPNVWKTDLKDRPDLMMLDGKMITYINKLTMALPRLKKLPEEITEELVWSRFGPKCKRCPGLDLLALKKDIMIGHRYFGKRKEKFWPTIGNVMAGWSNGKLYIRFANGSSPEKHKITATKGEGFTLRRASYLKFSDLHLRGSRTQIRITAGSNGNVIENCLMMHGGARIRINRGVQGTIVRNSILTAGFIRGDLFKLRAASDMRGGVLYLVFKYIIGTALSDDVGVQNFGTDTTIYGNMIMQGLIGTEINAPGAEFFNNVIMQMSSVGLYTRPRAIGEFHHNLYINNAIPIRIHEIRHERVKRVEYHYKNVIIQAPHDGSQIYVHCSSHLYGPDKVNFIPGTKIYKKNPPAPVDPGRFYIYHNTFWGGTNADAAFHVRYYSRRFRTVMPFIFMNNVAKGNHLWSSKTQEILTGNLLYGYPNAFNKKPVAFPEVTKENKFISGSLDKKLWNNKKVPAGIYDLTLAPDSPALGIGIDISRPFTCNGKKYAPLPGFKPGYFKGKAPAAGAFQAGESQQLFTDLYRRAQKAALIIKNAK